MHAAVLASSAPGRAPLLRVAGGLSTPARLLGALRIVTSAVSLGSTDTLIQHLAGLTHMLVDAETRREYGITDGLLRTRSVSKTSRTSGAISRRLWRLQSRLNPG